MNIRHVWHRKLTAGILDGLYIKDQIKEMVDLSDSGHLTKWNVMRNSLNIIMTGVGYYGWGGLLASLGYYLVDSCKGDAIWMKVSDGEIYIIKERK